MKESLLGPDIIWNYAPELINSTCCFLFLNFQFSRPPAVEAVLEPHEAAVADQGVTRHPQHLGAGPGGLQGAQVIITVMGATLK